MILSNREKAVIEIITLVLLIFLGAIALVFLFSSKTAVSTKELQQYNLITKIEAENITEVATAYIINKMQENPSTTSFEIFSPQSMSGVLSSEMPKFHIKSHHNGDIYSYSYIDIIDSSSKININQDDKAFFNILMNLTKITNNDYLLKLLELKTSSKIVSFVDLLTPFKKAERETIKNFFTVNSYLIEKIIAPSNIEDRKVPHKIGDNIYTLSELIPKDIRYLKKSYININTARYEVLYSLLKDLVGIYLSKDIGDIPESEKENLNPIGKLTRVEIDDSDAKKVAQTIINSRHQDSIKSWQQLESILRNTSLSEEKTSLILAALNPNANLNFFYPPHPLFKRINKIDVINYTTEVTFFPTGVFEFDVKVILAKKDIKLAAHTTYEVRKIFDILELSTQSDFAKSEFTKATDIIDIYPLNNNTELDGYLARKSLHSPITITDETLSISSIGSLDNINSTEKITFQNIAENKNNSAAKNLTIDGLAIDTTKTKEGFILDAKNQYLITIPNILNASVDIAESDKVYCSLANPLANKKLEFKSRGYLTGWFRCLEDISGKNIVTISNMADIWSNRFGTINIRSLFSNFLIDFGGNNNLKYTFKYQNYIPQNRWFNINLNWIITKNDKISNIELFLNGEKLDIEYFKNIKNLPLSAFFGLPYYKILTIGLSIGAGEYDPEYPYFFGLFDSIIISAKEPKLAKFKYDNREASIKSRLNLKTLSPLFISSSIYNGVVGIYYGDLPAINLGGNLFVFATKNSRDSNPYLYIKFPHKVTENGLTEIIDDIYVATINQFIISTTTLFY